MALTHGSSVGWSLRVKTLIIIVAEILHAAHTRGSVYVPAMCWLASFPHIPTR